MPVSSSTPRAARCQPMRPSCRGRWCGRTATCPKRRRCPTDIEVLHRDERLVVVDKPHHMATMPRGQPRRAERAGSGAGAHRAAPARTRPPARPADGGRAHADDGAALARRLPAGLRSGAGPQDLPRGRTGAPRPRAAASSAAPTSSRSTAPTRPGRCRGSGPTPRPSSSWSTLRATSASIGSRPRPVAPTSCAASCRASASPIVGDPLYPRRPRRRRRRLQRVAPAAGGRARVRRPRRRPPATLREPPPARRLAGAVAGPGRGPVR